MIATAQELGLGQHGVSSAAEKRRAFEATPEGIQQLAEARRRDEEEERRRVARQAAVEASGVRTKYAWAPGMGEISGFGGGYEAACRDMLYSGLAWLESRPGADLKASTYAGIYGVLNAQSPDAKALETVVLDACPRCSGAMHQAVMSACIYIAKNGWVKYTQAMTVTKEGR